MPAGVILGILFIITAACLAATSALDSDPLRFRLDGDFSADSSELRFEERFLSLLCEDEERWLLLPPPDDPFALEEEELDLGGDEEAEVDFLGEDELFLSFPDDDLELLPPVDALLPLTALTTGVAELPGVTFPLDELLAAEDAAAGEVF